MTIPPAIPWTPAEAAQFIGTTEDMLKKWRYQQKGPPYYKIGRSIRYQPAQVARWLRARQRGVEPVRTVARTIPERTTR